jgi:murein L,D-transpeptidase YcbB/YkuD
MNTLGRTPRFLAVLTLLFAGCDNRSEFPPPQVSQLLRQTLEAKTLPASLRDQRELVRAWEETRAFYQQRAFQPVWSGPRGPRPQAGELIEAIPALGTDGLDVRRYQPARLAALVAEAEAAESFDDPRAQRLLADLDLELTYTYLSLAAHLANGRLQPGTVRAEWHTKPRHVDLDARLSHALAAEDAGEILKILRSLTPPSPEYERLRQALVRHREILAGGGWGRVPPGPDLERGARGPRVAALRARLAASADLPGGAADRSGVFDPALAAAVSRFQKRHGLPITGRVDEETLAELNVPAADRVRQLQVNMERWRWMPSSLGDRHVLVNVPELRLDVVEAGRTALTMRVIVGKDQSRTPAFSDRMSYIDVNPYWAIPESIANEEILPKLGSDPGYLARQGIETVGESDSASGLRQRPGPANPLGKLKFMFPNDFNIYLHDTPAGHLFAEEERLFSHGCIRIEKPFELAVYLLRSDPKWTPQALQAAIDSGETTRIDLPRPLPVHILYWTAWVEPGGAVQFRQDVYGHDARLEQALAAEPPVWLDLGALRGEARAALERA